MENQKIKNLENRAVELFGEKALVAVTEIRAADKGYVVRIKMQGMPFEISSIQSSLEDAEETALAEFEKQMETALKNDLFATHDEDTYEQRKLRDEEFNKLFKHEEYLSKEYVEELKEETIVKTLKLENSKVECVIESPYLCLHARSQANSEKLAVASAIWVAYDVFNPKMIRIGNHALN